MKFTDFTLDGGLQEGLAEAGYITCMPVQEQVLQNGLEGADLYVQSQTGTGKTAAYLVTILQRLISDPALAGRKALIMVPTRELAVQVEEEARILGSCMTLKSASFYGGVGYGGQQDLLKKGVDIIIGTPGRVIDLQQSGTMDLSTVAFLVIDEADRMFDMGFYPDLRTLIKVLPKAENRQTMLFSATLNATVKNLAWEYTVEAKEITIECENVTVDEIDQLLFHVSSDQKMKLLLGLIKKEAPESVIVFCNTKRMSEVVAKRLKINGYEADFIIGDLPQAKRLQVIDSFKSGSLRMLVATDVAARGIDVDSLAMVINYDLPNEAENYVHRIGRTARAGKTGKAYSFCSEQDVYNLPAIEKYIENKVPTCVPGEEDFVEDQSAHVYIRTDRYDSDYADDDDNRGRGNRSRPSSGRSDSRGRSDGRGRPSGGHSGGSRAGSSRDGRDSRPGGNRSGPGRDRGDRQPFVDRPYEGIPKDRQPVENRPYEGIPKDRQDTRISASGTKIHSGSAPRRDGYRGGGNRGPSTEQDLSKLSFDERMAYYKSKYGSEEAAKAAENQRVSINPEAGDEGNRKPDARQNSAGRPQGDRPQGDRGRSDRGQNRNRQDRGPRDNAQRDNASRSADSGRGDNRPRNAGGQNSGRPTASAQGSKPAPKGNAPAKSTAPKNIVPKNNAPVRNGKQNSKSVQKEPQRGVGVGLGGFLKRLFIKK